MAVEDVELGLLERRGHLVLDHLAAGAVAHRVGAVLERLDPPHVQADRGVELQRLAARGGFRAVVDHNAVNKVVVRSRHLDVVAVHRSGRWLCSDLQHARGHQPFLWFDELGLDGELPAQSGQQLVVHRRMHIGRH